MASQQTLSDAALVVLYLDIDGVLHHQQAVWNRHRGIHMCPKRAPGRTLFEWLPVLENVLEPFPDVRLVLSSTWCAWPGYGKTLKRFSPLLRERFVGGTFHKRIHKSDPWAFANFQSKSRGQQILQDVQRRKPTKWLALDDDANDWPICAMDNLVKCDGETGISDPGVQSELKLKLEQCKYAAKEKS